MANGSVYDNTSCTVELGTMNREVAGRTLSLYLPKRLSFRNRFSHILTGFSDGWEEPEPVQAIDGIQMSCEVRVCEGKQETKEEEKDRWWEAVKETVRDNADLLEKVQVKCEESATTEWRKAVQEVLIDVMLEMEGLEPCTALVYIFEQRFSFFPTQFLLQELLSREEVLIPEPEIRDTTLHALRLAIRSGQVEFVAEFAKNVSLHTFIAEYNDSPLLHEAAATGNVDIYKMLVENGAKENVPDKENRTIMHVLAEHNHEKLALTLERVELTAQDNNGWTPLHQAVSSESYAVAELLLRRGSPVDLCDISGQTPLLIAVEKRSMRIMKLLLDHKADVGIVDHNDDTVLTIALALSWMEGYQYLINYCYEGEGSEALRKALKLAVKGKKDQLAAEKIRKFPPSEVVKMLQHQGLQELKFSFIKDFVDNPSMKKSTLAILDQFVLANTCVDSEVMESDPKGYPPDDKMFNPESRSFLTALSDQCTKEVALHSAVKALMEHKWKSFGLRLFRFLFALYTIRMIMFGAALFIAARPELDNPGCYVNGWDYARGVFEVLSLIIFLIKGYDEVRRMLQLKMAYILSYFHMLQIISVVLPLLIIPFRAATTWCASAGEGYCTPPANTTVMRNTSFSQSCIMASTVQWHVASLAYLVNGLRIVEYVAVFRITGVYVRILLLILYKDMIKFTLISFVLLYIFVGTFYLALRAGVNISADGHVTSDLQLFPLQTLYPWHALFTGIRILVEAESVLDGYFVSNEDTGKYIGYQWFSILFYLVFLFVVIVVLLNLLIAQMSNTYSRVQDEAEGTYAVAKARILSRLERYHPIFSCCKPFRETYYKKYLLNYEMTDKDNDWDKHDEKLMSLEKKVDSLAKKLDALAMMMTEVNQVALLGKPVAQNFTSPEPSTIPLDDREITPC